jgi:hypothetical protein
MVRDGILAALLLITGLAYYKVDVIRPFVHQYANAATCIVKNFETENLRALRSAYEQNVTSPTKPSGECRQA